MVRSAADILAELEAAETKPAAPGPVEPVERPTVLRWENPPPRSPRGNPNPGLAAPESKYAPAAAELRERPGEWGLLFVGSKATAASLGNIIRSGVIAAFRPAGDYDAVTRTVAGRTRTYARYLGDVG